jgi:hypothetical protein
MAKHTVRAKDRKERGMALLMALFALLLLSAIGLCMVLASDTETRIDANYSGSLHSYYAARSGLEEVRDRIKYPSTSPGGLADFLPQDLAGNPRGVLYVLNPSSGEMIDPTDPHSPYFDDQWCHDYNSGIPDKDTRCAAIPDTSDWRLPWQYSVASSTPLGFKWIRVNIKTNRIAGPYFVDQSGASETLDTRVCWDGQREQLSPGTPNPACDANGMQTVYMLTAMAATAQAGNLNGSRKILRSEVVAPSIRPPGVLTMGAAATGAALPVLGGAGIPSVALDGRPHKLDGTLATRGSCSAVAPLATNSGDGATQLEQALNAVRKSIVVQANSSCKADGTDLNGNTCTDGLWWVRGTDAAPRFIISSSNTSTSGSGTSGTSGSSDGSSSGEGGRNEDDDHHGGLDHHSDPSGVGDVLACDHGDPSCYTNLDLSAPELFATSATMDLHIPIAITPPDGVAPFIGGRGNQTDTSVYLPGSANIVKNGIGAVSDLADASVDQKNFYAVSSASLASSYGSSTAPAVVVITDSTLSLQNNAKLTGYGVLVIPGALEISNATLQWTGIVIVKSSSGHVSIGSGARGFINGALLLQPGAALNLQNSATSGPPTFQLTYSCEAIDLPFGPKPFKVISTTESSF